MENLNIIYLIGQLFGVVAVILGFVSYQMKTSKGLKLAQMSTSVVFCIHYCLIGARSAFAMNIVSSVRNYVYSNSDKKIFSYKIYPILFAVITAFMGFMSWEGAHSLFVIAGLVINTLAMSMKNPQSIRKSILISSPLVIIYDIFVKSFGGLVYEVVAIVSAIIGIIRYRKGIEE